MKTILSSLVVLIAYFRTSALASSSSRPFVSTWLEPNTGFGEPMAIKADGTKLYVSYGRDDGSVRCFDVNHGTLLKTFPGHGRVKDNGTVSIGTLHNALYTVSTDRDSVVEKWNTKTERKEYSVEVSISEVTDILPTDNAVYIKGKSQQRAALFTLDPQTGAILEKKVFDDEPNKYAHAWISGQTFFFPEATRIWALNLKTKEWWLVFEEPEHNRLVGGHGDESNIRIMSAFLYHNDTEYAAFMKRLDIKTKRISILSIGLAARRGPLVGFGKTIAWYDDHDTQRPGIHAWSVNDEKLKFSFSSPNLFVPNNAIALINETHIVTGFKTGDGKSNKQVSLAVWELKYRDDLDDDFVSPPSTVADVAMIADEEVSQKAKSQPKDAFVLTPKDNTALYGGLLLLVAATTFVWYSRRVDANMSKKGYISLPQYQDESKFHF